MPGYGNTMLFGSGGFLEAYENMHMMPVRRTICYKTSCDLGTVPAVKPGWLRGLEGW
jgi:hypothetical protein